MDYVQQPTHDQNGGRPPPPDQPTVEGDATLWREALGVNLEYGRLGPLISRMRDLSINAYIASARAGGGGEPFAIVAEELHAIAGRLSIVTTTIDTTFRDLAGFIAKLRSEVFYLKLLHRAADRTNSSREQEELAEAAGTMLTFLTGRHRSQIQSHLASIEENVMALSAQVRRIAWVAIQQCQYTSVAAQVEAAHLSSQTSELQSVADDITSMANRVKVLESAARSKTINIQHTLMLKLPSMRSHN